jgi:DNA polymerase III subunit epsilon
VNGCLCVNRRPCHVDVSAGCHTGRVGVLFEVPSLLVGFDVETTGLDTHFDEPISYGFAVCVDGHIQDLDEYFVLPGVQIHPGAERVHGVSYEHLRRMSRDGSAVAASVGATRAARRLAEYAALGATFVGANPMFDFSMLDSLLVRLFGGGLEAFEIDLSSLNLIDIVEHDRLIDPDSISRPRRGLSALCSHYDVIPGRHRAAEDARAALEVLIQQVTRVRSSLEQATSSVVVPLGAE